MKTGGYTVTQSVTTGADSVTAVPITAERLVQWAIRDCRADLYCQGAATTFEERAAGLGRRRRSADGCAAVERFGMLGGYVDRSMAPQRNALNTDAERVFNLVWALPRPINFLVLDHGRRGTRPDWRPDLRPLVWGPRHSVYDQAAATWRAAVIAGGRHRILPHCPVVLSDNRKVIEAARLLWLDWWSGLEAVSRQASGLRRWRVAGVGPPRHPWEGLDSASIA